MPNLFKKLFFKEESNNRAIDLEKYFNKKVNIDTMSSTITGHTGRYENVEIIAIDKPFMEIMLPNKATKLIGVHFVHQVSIVEDKRLRTAA